MPTKQQTSELRVLLVAALAKLDDIEPPGDIDSYMTAKLGDRGEWSPAWLAALNQAYVEKFPDGYAGSIGPDFGGGYSRTPLVLAGSIITQLALARDDLTEEQRAHIHYNCNVQAWGINSLTMIRDSETGIARIAPYWPDGVPTLPGEFVLALAPHYPNGRDLRYAVEELYRRAYGPL